MRRYCREACSLVAGLVGALVFASACGATPIATTATTETWRITYTIDTSGYDGTGVYINTVALKVSSSFVDATLV